MKARWQSKSIGNDENNLVLIVGDVGGGTVGERRIGVSGPCGEEAVGEDDEDGGGDGDFDLPQRGEEKREERGINKGDVHGVATETERVTKNQKLSGEGIALGFRECGVEAMGRRRRKSQSWTVGRERKRAQRSVKQNNRTRLLYLPSFFSCLKRPR